MSEPNPNSIHFDEYIHFLLLNDEKAFKSLKEEKPLPRYVVGNDAAMFLEAKKMKTDIEFENYLKKELYGE